MLFKYVAFHYLKNILIILLGLSGLFTGLDFLMHSSSLPSFNIKVLYAFFEWEEALSLLFPLAIVFGGIWTIISFIKQNYIASLYALGVTRRELYKPFFLISISIYLLFLGLFFTPFATARDSALELLSNSYNVSETNDLFFKYDDKFVYIEKLIPKRYKMENLTIFKMKDSKVIESFSAKEAWYNIDEWAASGVIKKTFFKNEEGKERLKVEKLALLRTLRGYKPKILKSLYDNNALSLFESYIAIKLLSKQGLSTHLLRAEMYKKLFMPLFSVALLMILFFNFPFHARYMNISVTTTKAIGGTLFVWGILFALVGMGRSGTISPEIAIVLPIILLCFYALYSLRKAQKRI